MAEPVVSEPVFSLEVLEGAMKRMMERPAGPVVFDPDNLPSGWRRAQPGEAHPNMLFAENQQTGYGEWLVWERAINWRPVLARLFGWGARVFILRDRLAVAR